MEHAVNNTITARAAGTLAIGGDIVVSRLGYGAMRITGEGVWGDPVDPAAALRTLRGLPELGVNFIDTADSYGPYVSERFIRKALHPYRGMLIATKSGMARSGPWQYSPLGRPEYLRQGVLMSLRRLRVEQLDLWQLHRIDPKVPRDEQFGAIAEMREEGLIRHVGLSAMSIDEIKSAERFFPVATVQNLFNLSDRSSEGVLDYCEERNIGFVPFFPQAVGGLAQPGSVLTRIAANHSASPGQIALAWLLRRSRVMLPIPGTGNPDHLKQNVAAAGITLSDEEFFALDALG